MPSVSSVDEELGEAELRAGRAVRRALKRDDRSPGELGQREQDLRAA